jgi:hypothetical protein
MNSHEIELNVKQMKEHFSKENFLYDLLLAYGICKTSITQLNPSYAIQSQEMAVVGALLGFTPI